MVIIVVVVSTLSGSHGEWTNADDMQDKARVLKEARNKMIHQSVGNSHKPAVPKVGHPVAGGGKVDKVDSVVPPPEVLVHQPHEDAYRVYCELVPVQDRRIIGGQYTFEGLRVCWKHLQGRCNHSGCKFKHIQHVDPEQVYRERKIYVKAPLCWWMQVLRVLEWYLSAVCRWLVWAAKYVNDDYIVGDLTQTIDVVSNLVLQRDLFATTMEVDNYPMKLQSIMVTTSLLDVDIHRSLQYTHFYEAVVYYPGLSFLEREFSGCTDSDFVLNTMYNAMSRDEQFSDVPEKVMRDTCRYMKNQIERSSVVTKLMAQNTVEVY